MNDIDKKNMKLAKKLAFVALGMFGFGFALVPLYDVFCDITGLNGKTSNSVATIQPMEVNKDRLITVRFVATVNSDLPWKFEPLQKTMRVHPGEINQVSYVAKNITSTDTNGQAVPSVSPGQAALFFDKTECFCFSKQLLKAGQEKEMPVHFVIRPGLPEDISNVVLSYTFFNSDSAT
jgi:cytochrome c oxidase assembly protein subunit 11